MVELLEIEFQFINFLIEIDGQSCKSKTIMLAKYPKLVVCIDLSGHTGLMG